jgi:hypothetical protein
LSADPLPSPRSREQRVRDTLEKLRTEVDLWVASADRDGNAYLVPLSYHWDGTALTIATPRASRTATNLLRAGRARVALGPTRDVLMIDGAVAELPAGSDPGLESEHAAATGFDPREEPEDYIYLRLHPETVQAWREADELLDRTIMSGGVWRT